MQETLRVASHRQETLFFGGLEAAVKLIDKIVCLFMSPPLTTSALTRRQEAIDSYQER